MKYPRSLAVTWETTLHQLGAQDIALLRLFAHFAPDPIPHFVLETEKAESVFQQAVALVSPDTAKAAGAAYQSRDALATLANYSMVKWDTQEELVTVHRVVQDWNLLRPHVAFAVAQADAEGISAPTSVLMGELGVLLHFQALYAEAEPLMGVVVILVDFTRNTGHEHPHLRLVFGNHAQLLAEMAVPEGEVQARLKSLLSGPEGPELDP